MARKLKSTDHDDQHALIAAVRESAQQIWQAGLGAFAKAQHEGSAWFDKLVQEGAALHELTRDDERTAPTGMAGKMSRLAEQVGKQAGGSWDKIEKIFEDRVARALASLGVPSREELAQLRREVAALRAELHEAAASAKPPARAAAKRAPARARGKAASGSPAASSVAASPATPPAPAGSAAASPPKRPPRGGARAM